MVTSLGWTWEEVREQLDIPRLEALNKYWETLPPAHIVIKKISLALGIGSENDGIKSSSASTKNTQHVNSEEEMQQLFSMLSPG